MFARFAYALLLVSGLLGLQVGPAAAYIDPGAGSLILQAIIGGVAGMLLALRMYWRRIRGYFAAWANGRRKGQDTTT